MNGKGAVKPGALSKPELDDGHSGAPEGTAVHRGGTPAPILYAVPALALTVLIVARHFEIVARKPIWAYGIAIVGSTVVSQWLDRWSDAPRGSWRLHVRVGFHAATVMSVIYLTGWGPALGLCFVYTALVDLQQSGAASWRAVLGWSLVCCAIGQVLVYEAVMPSFLNHTAAQSLGFLGAVAFSIVIVMAGAIGEAKDRTDGLLARTRDEALRREAHHRAVVENAAEGIIAINAEGSFLSFNAAAEAMFGWTAEEIVGRPAATIMPLERHDAVERFLGDCRSSPSPVVKANVETEGTRRDGTRFPMMLSASLIAGDNGEWIILGIIRDLSDQKRFEAQLAYQALHDPLTGLPNRIMLTDRLSQALVRVRRHQRMCGVLYVD
ncbi:MAG: PAS domain S-box protein, partial [Nitrososphaerales archaeon]